jgi:hypothetical protein
MIKEEKAALFLGAINEAQAQIQTQYDFIEQSISNPELLFADAHNIFGSWHAAIFQTLAYPINKTNIKVHELQGFLAELVEPFVKEWCRSNGVTHDVQVKVRNRNSFPSIFAIFSNGLEIMQFNLFEKKYGVRVKALSEEEIAEKYQDEMNRQQKNIDEFVEKIHLKRAVKANPYHYARNFKERVIVWCKMKTLQTNVDKQIEDFEKMIEIIEKNRADYEARVPQSIAANQIKTKLVDQLTPLFTEYDYTLEKMESALY